MDKIYLIGVGIILTVEYSTSERTQGSEIREISAVIVGEDGADGDFCITTNFVSLG
jgi:hypothetical protein